MMFGAISATEWVGFARLVRGQVLSLKEMGFIRAERALGIPQRMIIHEALGAERSLPDRRCGFGRYRRRHADGIDAELPRPGNPAAGGELGDMVSENLTRWRYDPHLVVMPGMVLAVAVFGSTSWETGSTTP